MTMRKVMTSIKMQKTLHQKMLHQIIADGYGMRGKSRWITEAISQFLTLSDYPCLVDIAENMADLEEIISLRLPEKLVLEIEKAVISVRRHYPSSEGVKSNLIRASIMQRLLRGPTSVTEVG